MKPIAGRIKKTKTRNNVKFDRKSIERKQRTQFIISIIASVILAVVFYMSFFYVIKFPALESLAFAASLAVLITEFMDNKFYKYQKTKEAVFHSLLAPLIIMIIYLILHHTGFQL